MRGDGSEEEGDEEGEWPDMSQEEEREEGKERGA